MSEHLDALYRAAVRFCEGSETDAEDLVQETALRAFRAFGSLNDLAVGRAWLFTTLLWTYLNRARATARRAEWLATDLAQSDFEAALERWQPSATPEDLLEHLRLGERIVEALDRLPRTLRIVLWLVAVEGFRQRETARMLEIAEGTVASRLYRARRQLRAELVAEREFLGWKQGG